MVMPDGPGADADEAGEFSDPDASRRHLDTATRSNLTNESYWVGCPATPGRRLGRPSATIHAWPMQHPVAASLLWSVALLVIFAPLATLLYRRRTTG